jgi:hypothetical protein
MPHTQRHAKRAGHIGTRDKSRNTMHKYLTESHLTDPAQHAHIRTIPAPDTNRHWRDKDRERGERRAPHNFSVAANGGAASSEVQVSATKVNTAPDQQDTFASKLRGRPAAKPENRPKPAAVSGGQAKMKRPPPLTLVSNGAPVTAILSPSPPVTSPAAESAIAAKPSKIIFAPRSIRAAAGETVSHLMREYGLQPAPDPHTQSFASRGDISTAKEDSKSPVISSQSPVPAPNFNQGNKLREDTADAWSQPRATPTVENNPSFAGVAGKYNTEAANNPRPVESRQQRQYPPLKQILPQGLLQSPPKEETNLAKDFGGMQLQQPPPPIDTSGRRGGISLPTTRPMEAPDYNRYTHTFPGPKTGGAIGSPLQ